MAGIGISDPLDSILLINFVKNKAHDWVIKNVPPHREIYRYNGLPSLARQFLTQNNTLLQT